MNYSIVIDVKDTTFFIKSFSLFKQNFKKDAEVYLLMDVKDTSSICLINEEYFRLHFIDSTVYDPFSVSSFIPTDVYLYVPSDFVPVKSIELTNLFCTLDSFPHDDASTLSNRDCWMDALKKLGHPLNGYLFEYHCMTKSPQFIIKDVIDKEKNINSIEMYWFYLFLNNLHDIYMENDSIWRKELCYNVYKDIIPQSYQQSNIENGLKTDTMFIKIINSDCLLNTIYKKIYTPTGILLKTLMDNLNVYWCNIRLIRLGEKLDGGYVLADVPVDVVYGFGVGTTYLFEKDVINRYYSKKVYLYDHTVDIHIDDERIIHKKYGIDFFEHDTFNTLENFIRENEDTNNTNMLLKIDVEGYEWMSLLHTREETLLHFKQIVIELHYLDSNFMCNTSDKIKVLEKINKHFILIHIHGTNCCKTSTVDGFIIHPVVECTFLRKDLIDKHIIKRHPILPSYLDAPTDGMLNEIILSNFYPYKQ